MSFPETEAQTSSGKTGFDPDELSTALIVPLHNNFVERPWGGMKIRAFKQLCSLPEQISATGFGLGESFEIAAYDRDDEARDHPSLVRMPDTSVVSLPTLLAAHGEHILGIDFVQRFGACFPLLPKTLDIKELLSVQVHPPGHTEAYIIIDAEPGASIRLGFNTDIDAAQFKAQLITGLKQQQDLLALFTDTADLNLVQRALKLWFADASADSSEVEAQLLGLLVERAVWPKAAALLLELKARYWNVLDKMNVISVRPGQVIYNATPARLLAQSGRLATAEVHALGNPHGHEILALEVRRPGPTLRAWDNVRFPLRQIQIDAAVDAMNLSKTDASEFIVEPVAVPGFPGVSRSIDSEYFCVEHLAPTSQQCVTVPQQAPHCLHVLSGRVAIDTIDGDDLGTLARGQSALIPIGVGAYRINTADEHVDMVKVSLPHG